jgi:uncharacterized membrane protein YgdD (TMEM256/DUF423 family)
VSKPTYNFWLIAAALTGATAVAIGAMGAHALETVLEQGGHTEAWKTASTYHLVHAVLLLVVSRWQPVPRYRWWLFSGSIYLLCLTSWKWLGPVTPVGGMLLIVGWISLAAGVTSQTLAKGDPH